MSLIESAANIKRLAVAGKTLPWCIDSGLIKEWGGRQARYNTAGWLPLNYAQALGVGGRNGVEILPNVVMQANHLGYVAGQIYYSLDAAGKLLTRNMVRGMKLPSYDISIAVLDGVSVRHAPLAPVGFALPVGTPVVMGDNDGTTQTKNAIIAQVTQAASSLIQNGQTVYAPWLRYGQSAVYPSFYIGGVTGDSSGGVILLTDGGPVTVGVRQDSRAFINCCDPKVRAEIDAVIAKLKPETQVITSNNPPLSVANLVLGQNPFAYMRLADVNGTTAAAVNPTTFTGTYTGGFTLGVAGGVSRDNATAVSLNGSTGYVNTGTLGSLGSLQSNGITIQCRIRTTQTSIAAVWGHSAASFSPSIFVVINQNSGGGASSGRLRFYIADSSGVTLTRGHNSATSINDGAWHTVAWSMSPNSGTGSIFLDGVSLAMTTGTAGSPSNHVNFARNTFLGALNLNGSVNSPLNGSLQDFVIYNRAITLEEHQAFHLACVNGAFGSIAGQIG